MWIIRSIEHAATLNAIELYMTEPRRRDQRGPQLSR